MERWADMHIREDSENRRNQATLNYCTIQTPHSSAEKPLLYSTPGNTPLYKNNSLTSPIYHCYLMSLILNPNRVPQDLIHEHDRFSTSSKRCIQFEIQAALIPDRYKFQYQSARDLAMLVKALVNQKHPEQYLYFRGISDGGLEAIESALREAQIRPAVLFTFENALDSAILPIRPGMEHGIIAYNFAFRIGEKIDSIPCHIANSVSGLVQDYSGLPGCAATKEISASGHVRGGEC